jgi:hypothetical protein
VLTQKASDSWPYDPLMPQATEELRSEWGVMPERAIEFLLAAGYRLTDEWTWESSKPSSTPEERRAMLFLIQEWDFGGLAG